MMVGKQWVKRLWHVQMRLSRWGKHTQVKEASSNIIIIIANSNGYEAEGKAF